MVCITEGINESTKLELFNSNDRDVCLLHIPIDAIIQFIV